LLWHNSSLDTLELPGWVDAYERAMEYIGKQNVFNQTAQGIIDWWEKREDVDSGQRITERLIG